ncbi:MAG TPA: DUF4139 domain-containing protein [Planctomycetota bacterium]|jgi:hypothetical protein
MARLSLLQRNNWLAALLALSSISAFGVEETPVKSAISSVGLFKNGLAVVRREVNVPGPGIYVVEDVPEPVHGTWWVQCEADVETQVTEREIAKPVSNSANLDLQQALVGKTVTINFREGQIPPASGKVEAIKQAQGEEAWTRTYQRPRYDFYGWNGGNNNASAARFLVLQTDNGRVFVDSSMIAYLKADGKDEQIKQRVPVLLLNVRKMDKPAPIVISYLTKGMAWAPSYRVDISDPKTLAIEQAAVIKNELDDIDNAELRLISGFPSMQFSHVVSPLSLRTNWTNFFQQLNQRIEPGHASTRNAVAQQAMVNFNEPMPGATDLGAIPTGEGVDLHYQNIGKRSLKEGDSISLSVARANAPYERIIEWMVPDTRNADGRQIEEYQRQQDPDKYQDAAWDALRFKNPFKFPMTTAPAAVVSGENFLGQQMSYWVNSGEETRLRVTKALSLRTRSTEHEEEGQRDIVYIGGRTFRKTNVTGALTVNNHRKEDVSLVIRRQFSGELISADAEPKKSLREEGVYSVNPRYELFWTMTLKPGEEKTLNYKYTVLVAH